MEGEQNGLLCSGITISLIVTVNLGSSCSFTNKSSREGKVLVVLVGIKFYSSIAISLLLIVNLHSCSSLGTKAAEREMLAVVGVILLLFLALDLVGCVSPCFHLDSPGVRKSPRFWSTFTASPLLNSRDLGS